MLVARDDHAPRSSPATSSRSCRRSPPRPRSPSTGRAPPTRLPMRFERERLVASIGRKVRSELDLEASSASRWRRPASRSASTAASSASANRSEPMPIAAEWHTDGFAPIGDVGRPAGRHEPRGARAPHRGRRGHARGIGVFEDPELGGIEPLHELDSPRSARDAGPRVRPDDRRLRVPPRRAGRVVGCRDRPRRGRCARARDCDPRRAAAPRERAAPRAADCAAQGGRRS